MGLDFQLCVELPRDAEVQARDDHVVPRGPGPRRFRAVHVAVEGPRRVAARASASCLRHDRAISLLQGPFLLGQHAAHLQTVRCRSVRKLVCAREEAVEVGPLPLQCLAVHRQLHRVSGPLVDVQGGPYPPQLVVAEPRHEQARAALLLRVRQEVDQAIAASAG